MSPPRSPSQNRVAVTGAAGFVGSHLCERLIRDSYQVLGIDNSCAAAAAAGLAGNIAHLANERSFCLLEADLREELPRGALRQADAVFHLAARPGVRGIDAAAYFADNVVGTANVLRAARADGVRDVVFASSSSVYGPGGAHPSREADVPAPATPYARTKVLGECMCRMSGLRCVTVRYFSVYGPRQRRDMAFSRFIAAALEKKPAPIYAGQLNAARDYTYVDDAVDGTLLAWRHGRADGVFNIGSGAPISLANARVVLEQVLGKRIPCKPEVSPVHEARLTHGDLTRSRAELGYTPRVPLEEGMRAQVGAALDAAELGRATAVPAAAVWQ